MEQLAANSAPYGKTRIPLMERNSLRATSCAPPAGAGVEDDCLALLRSSSRTLSYALRVSRHGLTVNQHRSNENGDSIILTMHFSQASDFGLWWSSDPLRFEEPHLYQQLFNLGHGALPDER